MAANKISDLEEERLGALLKYKILDTPHEKEFDDITRLASYICQTPIALISLIDGSRQWFKSRVGLDVDETPREISFCQHAIKGDTLFEINNALQDDRFKENPLVTGAPDIRFYAGTPLKSASGYNIGTLCVIDTVARSLTEEQRVSLETLGNQVIASLELRDKNAALQLEIENLAIINNEKNKIQEILEQKNAELEKANKEVTAGDMFFSLSVDLLFVATCDRFIKVNPSFISLLGYDEAFLLEIPFMLLCHPDDKDSALEALEKLQEGSSFVHFVARYRCKDGLYKWLDWGVSPDLNTGLRYGLAHDITDLKQKQEELIQSKEIAEHLVGVKDRFLANMSHEIRTPLNAVIGFTDLLDKTNLDDIQRDYINSVQVAGENLLHIVNDILDLSKIESGNLLIEKRPFYLRKTLQHVHALFKDKAAVDVNFNLIIDNNVPEIVLGDQGRLNQILLNLVGNALKFTEKGSVTVKVKSLEENASNCSVEFSIKDTGIGIPENQLGTIFDRFTQAEEETTRRFGGTGLGLNIVKQLLELHGSKIFVNSKHNFGSEFYFVINYAKSNQTEILSKEIITQELGYLKILLCEDNVLNQKLANRVISNFGFDLDIAENGEIGISLLEKNKYDLILMDLQMPIKDGYQATKYIRDVLKSEIPIIAMSAHSLIGEEQRCYDAGMNGFVPKPFKQAELLKAINSILNIEKKYMTNRKINFSYIDDMAGDNKDFKQEVVNLFIKQIPDEVLDLEQTINQNDYEAARNIIHKLKSSLDVFMLNDCLDYASKISEEAHKKSFTVVSYTNIKYLKSAIEDVVDSLK